MKLGRSAESLALLLVCVAAASAQQPATTPAPTVALVPVLPIEPPPTPLSPEAASAGITRFSFVAYGDTRCNCYTPEAPGPEVQVEHGLVADAIVRKAAALAATPHPVRLVVQSGDAVYSGASGERWSVFNPIIEKITRGAGLPYFFAVGNHDVTGVPGDPVRALGLHYTLTAMSKLIPPEGSPRRLSGYPTYAIGYGNAFFIAIDSNIASDEIQLAWVTGQLEHLDRTRYRHVIAFFHHPPFSSGPHGGASTLEPPTVAIRDLYMPLFRRHHVRMTIAGHDHLYDHWVERYVDNGVTHRMDDVLTGGGGAPIYVYAGEPDLQAYLAAGAAQRVGVEHLVKPGATNTDNPHHFVVIQVDGDHLSLEVVASGGAVFAPYNGRSRIDLADTVQ